MARLQSLFLAAQQDAVIALLEFAKGTDEEAACSALNSLDFAVNKSDNHQVTVMSTLRESSNEWSH